MSVCDQCSGLQHALEQLDDINFGWMMKYVDETESLPVNQLTTLSFDQLRIEWRRRYGPPPQLRSVELLALMLAYRIQADQAGGVSVELRRNLRRTSSSPGLSPLRPGTKLSREWQGIRHDVVVEADGQLSWSGGRYASLSHVARAITGTRWNGPRFFGLRAEAAE